MLSRPEDSTPTVGRQTTAKRRITKSVTGPVLTPGLCLKCGPIKIPTLILKSAFLTEPGDVFADPAFPLTRSRSAMPCKLVCFRRANAPATMVHRPIPNFAVGQVSIPQPLLPCSRNANSSTLQMEMRGELLKSGR